MPRILIADDEDSIRLVLTRAFEKSGWSVVAVSNGDAAWTQIATREPDVAFVDIRMPGLSGLDIVARAGEIESPPPIIVMTAQDTMSNAVTAMKSGAFDYIAKPFDLEEAVLVGQRAFDAAQTQRELERLKRERAAPSAERELVGTSRAMREVFKTVGMVADRDVSVLIEGESGTGKEMVARALHFSGTRAAQSFVAVNCSAVPEHLMESEFFGHKKGAFTGADADKEGFFERAHRGTVFLDEIGDMPQALQAKLLRFLQEKTLRRLGGTTERHVDVRVVAATNRDLKEEIRAGRFREDLYFRLGVVPIALPPLRERREDIAPLAHHFAAKFGKLLSASEREFTMEALAYFSGRDWPGNVRELENAVKRVIVLSRAAVIAASEARSILDGDAISPSDDGAIAKAFRIRIDAALAADEINLYDKLLPLFERPLILATLQKTGGNQLKAADILGINRNTLRKKIQESGI